MTQRDKKLGTLGDVSGRRWRKAGALALIVLALAGCGKRSNDKLDQARQLLSRNDRAGALVYIKAEIQANPKSGDARLLLGQVLLDGGDLPAAEIELRRALELRVPEPVVVPLLARTLMASGQLPKLIKEFGEVSFPDAEATARLKTIVAEAQAMSGDLAAARTTSDQAIKSAPALASAQVLKVRITAAGGDLPGALKQLDELLAANAKNPEAWVIKGELLARQPQASNDDVLKAYREALAVKADHAAAHAALIANHLGHRDVAAAQAQFETMRKLLPKHPQTMLYDGQLTFLKGDLPRARDIFQSLLKVMPNHLVLLQTAGAVELKLNAPGQAEALLVRAFQLEPASVATRRLLAQCYLAMGQPAKVGPALEPMLASGQADAETVTMAAQARLLLGDAAGANQLFDRAAKLKPNDPKIRTAMALSKVSKGQGDAAIVDLQSVAAADTGTSADMALVATHLRRKAYDAALKAIDGLEKKLAGQPMPAHLRGQVLMAKKDAAGARGAFEQAVTRDPKYFPSVAALAGLDYLDKKPDAARGRFEALLKLDPKHAPARLALAELAARSGAKREAVTALLEEAVKVSPTDQSLRVALIDHHVGGGDYKAALAASQGALARLPENPDLLGRLGQAQLRTGDHQQALNTYNRMAALQPKSPVGYLGAAEAQLQANDVPAASRSIKKAQEVAPDHLPTLQMAMRMALKQRQPDQARAIAREVQKQRPDDALGYLLEGEVELSIKRPDAAVPVLRKAIGKANPAQAPERLHMALRMSGKAAEADALATSWLQSHPDDLLFSFYLGDVAMGQKNYPLAESRYQAVLKLSPEHPLSLNNVAWLMMAQKKPGALDFAERAVRAAPDRAPLLDTLAQALALENQLPKALDIQKRAITLQPDDPGLRLSLAKLYAQAGDKKLAKIELDRLAVMGDRFAGQDEVSALLKSLGGR